MKPDAHIKNFQSNLEGEGVKMSIDESATAHLMDVLTKLYADPELACIREYSTNALDSHIEAGVNRAIEVTLPSQLAPFLTIRDWGVGLDADGIRDIYSRYGTSTKRGSNDAVGMLGLGCKSALAYTDQFTLTGYKDGFKTEVLISRDEDGAGTMTIVSADTTDEGNGVKVTIPVKAKNQVAEKAKHFFAFWTPGTVLVDGQQPERVDFHEKGDARKHIWLEQDRILLTNQVNESIVVMGNVPYPLPEDEAPLFQTQQTRRYNSRTLSYEYGSEWNAVCFVDIGMVNFVPSRESLMGTKRTKAALEYLRERIANLRDDSIRKQIAAAPDAAAAQQLLRDGMSMGFKKEDAVWQGEKVVLELRREGPHAPPNVVRLTSIEDWAVDVALKHSYLHKSSSYYSRKAGERNQRIDLAEPCPIFVNFDGKILTNVKRAKLELWCSQNKIAFDQHMIFVDALTKHEKFWTSGWDIYNWEDVAATDLPKSTMPNGSSTRLAGSYDAYVKGDRKTGIAAAAIQQEASKGTPLLWVRGNLWAAQGSWEVRSGAVDFNSAIIVCLGANRVDKFCRDFPQAKQLSVAAKEAAERWVKKQDTDTVAATLVKEALDGYPVKSIDPTKVDDPDLRDVILLYGKDTTSYTQGRERYSRYITDVTPKAAKDKVTQAERVMAKYKLLPSLYQRYGAGRPDKEHLHLYLNAAYKAEKGA